jgi:hypothetical protein
VVGLIITAPERMPLLHRAVRDALAIYYYPGMWDWDRSVRLPLVTRELERAVTRPQAAGGCAGPEAGQALRAGRALLDRYVVWAPSVDRFAPVMVAAEFDVAVPDPADPASGLVTPDGAVVRYGGRVDLLAADEHDAYWIVRHRLTAGGWAPAGQLAADQEARAACWAWEQFYLGMTITGTIWNELRVTTGEPPGPVPVPVRRRWPWRRRREAAVVNQAPLVRQHEPSGGGRSLPHHRRQQARDREPARAEPVEQVTGDGFRRTWVRHPPAEIAAAGQRLATDLAAIVARDPVAR